MKWFFVFGNNDAWNFYALFAKGMFLVIKMKEKGILGTYFFVFSFSKYLISLISAFSEMGNHIVNMVS